MGDYMDFVKAIQSSNIIKVGTRDKEIQKNDFKEFLMDSIGKVNADQQNAEAMDKALMLGEVDNVHDVMIASQKAELSLSFAVEIRNKVLEAYKEIMRLQM